MADDDNALFAPSDIPSGWVLAEDQSVAGRGDQLCEVLGIPSSSAQGWGVIERPASGLVALLLVRRNSTDDGGRATAVAFWSRSGRPVTGADLRSLPVADLEQRFSKRRILDRARVESAVRAWPSFGTGPVDPLAPVGSRADADSFYARVAVQWITLAETAAHPTAEIASINGVSLRVAQTWVTGARRRGLLPPGRRGRAK